MDIQDYIKFATENPFCSLATTEGDQPRVRTFMFWFGDEKGFYFETLAPKEVCKQLKKNPKVEVNFFNNAAEPQTGEAHFWTAADIMKESEIERIKF